MWSLSQLLIMASYNKLAAGHIGPLSLSSPEFHLFSLLASDKVDPNLPCLLRIYSLYSQDMFQEKLNTDMPL